MPGDKTLSGLVTNWGGFEELIAEIHDQPSFSVERDVRLPAREGGTYQIDVALRWTNNGLYPVLMICECKWWKHAVDREVIIKLAHVKEQVGAHRAACFTSVGFESGAEHVATDNGIDLFLVRDLTDQEWGAPGPVVTGWVQTWQLAISPFQFQGAVVPRPTVSPSASLEPESIPLFRSDGSPAGTMATVCEAIRDQTYAKRQQVVWERGDGTYYQVFDVTRTFADGPRIVQLGEQQLQVAGFTCAAIWKVTQAHFHVDRRENFDFALVVENFVKGEKFAATRRAGSGSDLSPLTVDTPDPERQTFQNGQIISVLMRGYANYDECAAAVASIEAAQKK
jgi:hypothetical protein